MAASHNLMVAVVRGHSTGADPKSPNIDNVYFYARSSLTPPATKASFYTIFAATVLTPIYPLLSVAYVMDAVDVRFQDDALDPFVTQTGSLQSGAVTGDFVPSLMNVSVRLGTGIRGKSYRGRKSFGPIAKSATLADKLTSAAITAWAAVTTALVATLTDSNGNVWFPVILSRQPPYQMKLNPTAGMFNQVTTAVLNTDLGRMKRRGQKA
jgi:hypothetical protein